MQLGGAKLKIFSASLVDLSGTPGQVVQSDRELVIAAGQGGLRLNEIQLEGKRRMSAAEFLRGHSLMVRPAS